MPPHVHASAWSWCDGGEVAHPLSQADGVGECKIDLRRSCFNVLFNFQVSRHYFPAFSSGFSGCLSHSFMS